MKGEKIREVLSIVSNGFTPVETEVMKAYEELDQLIAETQNLKHRIKLSEIALEQQKEMLTARATRCGELIAENTELKEQNIHLGNMVNDYQSRYDSQVEQSREDDKVMEKLRIAFAEQINDYLDKIDELEQQLEEQKKYAEIGRVWEWYYTECRETFGVSGGGKLTKKQRYQMLYEAILNAHREQVGE